MKITVIRPNEDLHRLCQLLEKQSKLIYALNELSSIIGKNNEAGYSTDSSEKSKNRITYSDLIHRMEPHQVPVPFLISFQLINNTRKSFPSYNEIIEAEIPSELINSIQKILIKNLTDELHQITKDLSEFSKIKMS